MAGVIVLTALLFLSGMLVIAGLAHSHRLGGKASSILLVGLIGFLLAAIVGMWLRTIGVHGELTTSASRMLIILGPGLSFGVLLITLVVGPLIDPKNRNAPAWARVAVTLMFLSLMTVLGLTIYGDWLARFYGWDAISRFADTPLGWGILWTALAIWLAAGLYNRFVGKRNHAQ